MGLSNHNTEPEPQVYAEDIQSRPAPLLEVGAIAWVRENLVKTWLDVFLTISGIILAVLVTVYFILWAVNTANWWSISFNFRQFMLGRYEAAYEWRIILATIVAVFCCGMAVAVWVNRISRIAAMTVVALLVLLFVVPTLIIALVPMPQTFVSASAAPLVVGSATEAPAPLIAFLGREGDEISIRLVDNAIQSDDALAEIAGFMDSTVNLMRTAAGGRLNTLAREAFLREQLALDAESAIPIFTANQRAQRETELSSIQVQPPVVETYGLGQPAVTVQVMNGAMSDSIGPAVVLRSPDDMATFVLPADGWYVLQKSVEEGDEGIAVLSLNGIYPIIRSTALAGGEEGTATTGFASAYIRMTDNFRVNGGLPRVDGSDLPFYNIVNNQYRGTRSLDNYLRLYLAPFLQKLSYGGFLLLAAGVAGYWTAVLLKRMYSLKLANRVTAYVMIILPLFIWVMAAGFTVSEIFNTAAAVAALMFVVFMYYAGNYWGRSIISLVILIAGAVAIAALPRLIFETRYGIGLLPLLNRLAFVPALLALLAGSATYGVYEPWVARRNLIIVGALLAALYLGPLLLIWTDALDPNTRYPNWILAASDQRRWGGLLLTMILTIFGIIAAFPIGVGLALGRRSKLPAIKYGCTLYIELVRGSPFITVLFMMQLMIPLINPAFSRIPGTMRALIAVIMFSAAYLAENVRGGLQSLPPGQTEAARALGLGAWQVTFLITLPQALRAVIPALVGQFIALFKDTSLVAIVGLTDLTGFVNIMAVQAEFIGTRAEGLLFITVVYFVFSYVMSYVSRLLEASGSGSTRRL